MKIHNRKFIDGENKETKQKQKAIKGDLIIIFAKLKISTTNYTQT